LLAISYSKHSGQDTVVVDVVGAAVVVGTAVVVEVVGDSVVVVLVVGDNVVLVVGDNVVDVVGANVVEVVGAKVVDVVGDNVVDVVDVVGVIFFTTSLPHFSANDTNLIQAVLESILQTILLPTVGK